MVCTGCNPIPFQAQIKIANTRTRIPACCVALYAAHRLFLAPHLQHLNGQRSVRRILSFPLVTVVPCGHPLAGAPRTSYSSCGSTSTSDAPQWDFRSRCTELNRIQFSKNKVAYSQQGTHLATPRPQMVSGAKGNRTLGLEFAKLALSQLSYSPNKCRQQESNPQPFDS